MVTVGDLIGFVLLGAVLLRGGRRLRHEALICLACIGVVLLLAPGWPLRLDDRWWWLVWGLGLLTYLALRQPRTGHVRPGRGPASGARGDG